MLEAVCTAACRGHAVELPGVANLNVSPLLTSCTWCVVVPSTTPRLAFVQRVYDLRTLPASPVAAQLPFLFIYLCIFTVVVFDRSMNHRVLGLAALMHPLNNVRTPPLSCRLSWTAVTAKNGRWCRHQSCWHKACSRSNLRPLAWPTSCNYPRSPSPASRRPGPPSSCQPGSKKGRKMRELGSAHYLYKQRTESKSNDIKYRCRRYAPIEISSFLGLLTNVARRTVSGFLFYHHLFAHLASTTTCLTIIPRSR